MKKFRAFAISTILLLISYNANAIIEITSVSCICPGGTGSIELTVAPDPGMTSAGPYAFQWSVADPISGEILQSGFDIEEISSSGLYQLQATIPGFYTVIITNFFGCETTLTTEVTLCAANTTITPTMVNCICPGGYGSIEIDVEGNDAPYSFIWLEPGGNNVFSEQNPSLLTETGNYTLTVTGNSGCTSTLIVNVPPCDFSFSNFTVNINNSCDGPGTGSIEVIIPPGIGSAPYLFEWSDSEGNPISQVNSNNNIATASGLSAGEYCLEVFSAGLCYTSSCGLIISEAEPPTVSYTIDPETFEGNDGQIHLVVNGNSGPFTYLWSNGATTQNLPGLNEGLYTVTIFYGNDACSLEEEIEVLGCESLADEIELLADVYALSGGNPNGDGAIDLTVSGGENYSFNYSWSSPSGFTSSLEDISGLKAGTYYVTVTHGQCSNIGKTGFWELCDFGVRVSKDISNPNTCSGMQLIAVPNTYQPSQFPFSYLWSDGSTTESVTAGYNSEYCVTVTSATGCSAKACFNTDIAPLEITAQMLENATFGNPDGSATAHAQGWFGNYSYSWSNGETTQTIFGVPAGLYTVTVTAACGVTATAQVEIACEFSTADFNPQVTPVNCQLNKYGVIKLNPSQAVLELNPVFQWSNGETTQDIFLLLPGEYSVTVTGVTNNTTECYTSMTFTVPKVGSGGISTSLSVDFGCPGGNNGEIIVNASGGFPPTYSYQWATWYGSQPLPPDPTISNLMPGWYFLTVTDEAGCTSTNWTMITPQPSINAQVSVTPSIICPGETASAVVQASGGVSPYNYVWQDCYPCTPFAGNNSSVSGLSSGPYMVTVTDQNNCKRELYFSVQGSNMKMNAQVHHPCEKKGADGSVKLYVSGGIPPYSYLWSNGSTGTGVSNLSEGPVSVTVTDANGCVKAESYYIKHESINLNIYAGTLPCPDGTNGSLSVNSNLGGHPPFQYNWSNGSTQSSLSGLTSGFYCVTVTDANGCSASKCQYLKNRFNILIEKIKNPTTYNSNDGLIDLTVTGSGGPFSFNWSNGATTDVASGLSMGWHDVTITSASTSCIVNNSFLLYSCSMANYPLQVELSSKNNLTAVNAADGSVSLTVTGGSGSTFYQWTGPSGYTANTKNIAGLGEGKYCVTVTDGCDTKTLCEWIGYCGDNVASLKAFQYGRGEDICLWPYTQAELKVTFSGLTGNPKSSWFAWNNPANFSSIVSNVATFIVKESDAQNFYSVIVTDDAGCSVILDGINGVYLYKAYERYYWKTESVVDKFGIDVYSYFNLKINNDPVYNFSVDKYVAGWKFNYECPGVGWVKDGASGNGTKCFKPGDFSNNPAIYDCDCEMPPMFNVTGKSLQAQSPGPPIYAKNAVKLYTYHKNLGNCQRRDYCLYWTDDHHNNYEPIEPVPFIFVSDPYSIGDCGGGIGSGNVDPPSPDSCTGLCSTTGEGCTFEYIGNCEFEATCLGSGVTTIVPASHYMSACTLRVDGIYYEVLFCSVECEIIEWLYSITIENPEDPNINWCDCGGENPFTGNPISNSLMSLSPDTMPLSGIEPDKIEVGKQAFSGFGQASNCSGKIELKPNPFINNLTVSITSSLPGPATIRIFNIFGTELWRRQQVLDSGFNLIKWEPDQKLPAGAYFIQVTEDNGCRFIARAVYSPN